MGFSDDLQATTSAPGVKCTFCVVLDEIRVTDPEWVDDLIEAMVEKTASGTYVLDGAHIWRVVGRKHGGKIPSSDTVRRCRRIHHFEPREVARVVSIRSA